MPRLCLFFPKYFEDPCWAGSSFSLEAPEGNHDHGRSGEWVLGRLPTCDITLATQSVSRRHCSLAYSYASDRWTVTDLGSKNGTRLNGKLLNPGDPHPVKVDDKLHLGPNPIHLVENEQSTEGLDVPTTIAGLTPLDHRTGEPLTPPAPAPSAPAPSAPDPSAPPKTLADTLYLGASWLITPSTALGMVYRLVVLAVASAVVVLVMGGAL